MNIRLLPIASLALAGWASGAHIPAAAQDGGRQVVLIAAASPSKGATAQAQPSKSKSIVDPRRPRSSYQPSSAAAVPSVGGRPARSSAKPVTPAAKPKNDAPAASGVQPESVGLSSQRLQRIGEVFRHEIKSGRLPGAAVMVARRGRVAYQQAWGHLDPSTKAQMRADAIFRIYGLGQPIIAVAALMLVEDGLIELTDPVAKFLPAMGGIKVLTERGETPVKRAVTIHDLLRQTAGLSYGDRATDARLKRALADAGFANPVEAAMKTRILSPQDMIGRLSRLPLATEPGTTWEVGAASDLLGRLVEVAAGKPLGVFLKERMFEPLGMNGATFHLDEKDLPRLAQPFAGTHLVDMTIEPGNESIGSGLAMPTSDYLRFAQMLLNGGILDGKRVMSPSSVKLMTSDHLGRQVRFEGNGPGEFLMGTPGYTFGLGVAVREADGLASVPGSKGEYGWGSMAGSFFWVDPEEELVAVYQSQAPAPDRERYRRLIKQLVYQAIIN